MELVATGLIEHDAEQWLILSHLQELLEQLANLPGPLQSRLPFYLDNAGRSLYIFGAVGRGKSMLMELFYESCPIAAKRRVHFNVFMQEVHLFVHQQGRQGGGDPFLQLAKRIKSAYLLLCFDEFQLTDIADAMILARLFGKLFELGVVIVMTSNRHPDELHQGGLQKEQLSSFIKILRGYAKIIELSAERDYRLGQQAIRINYHYPLDSYESAFIAQWRQKLIGDGELQPAVLEVLGRKLYLQATCGGLALFSFAELCASSLGTADYLAIAKRYRCIILTGIPKLPAASRNEAKRLVSLVDVLYEHRALLVCSAEAAPEELYQEGDGQFEFKRTISRLIEMQSERYLQRHGYGF